MESARTHHAFHIQFSPPRDMAVRVSIGCVRRRGLGALDRVGWGVGWGRGAAATMTMCFGLTVRGRGAGGVGQVCKGGGEEGVRGDDR